MAKEAYIKLRCTTQFKSDVERLAKMDNRTVSNYLENLLKKEIENMKDYNGMQWRHLSEQEKEMLLSEASAIDASTGCKPKKTSDCTIDLNSSYSVPGRIIVNEDYDEIIIDDDAMIYNPSL